MPINETIQLTIDEALSLVEKAYISELTTACLESYVSAGVEAAQQVNEELKKEGRAEISIRFDLITQEALDYAKEYAKDLTKKGGSLCTLEDGTQEFKPWLSDMQKKERKEIAKAIETAVREGESRQKLKKALLGIFDQKQHDAELTAQMEVAKIRDVAHERRWEKLGVPEEMWITVGDEHVRPTHRERDRKKYKLGKGPALGEPNCRCVKVPIVPPA